MSIEELEKLIQNLGLSKGEVNKAMKRAIGTVLRGSKTLMARDIAQDTKVKVKILSNRMKIFDREKDIAKKLSMITYSVPAILAGRYRKTKYGYMVGSHNIKGAFVHPYQGREIMFKRKGKSRYPLVRVRVPVHSSAEQALIMLEARIDARLRKAFARELEIFGGVIEF